MTLYEKYYPAFLVQGAVKTKNNHTFKMRGKISPSNSSLNNFISLRSDEKHDLTFIVQGSVKMKNNPTF